MQILQPLTAAVQSLVSVKLAVYFPALSFCTLYNRQVSGLNSQQLALQPTVCRKYCIKKWDVLRVFVPSICHRTVGNEASAGV